MMQRRLRQLTQRWPWLATPRTRSIAIVAISFLLALVIILMGVNYILNRYINPVDRNDATPITVVIESNDSASTIATKLFEACGKGEPGLITNKAIFKVYVDFVGKANKLRSGTYVLSKNMDLAQIVDILSKGEAAQPTVTFTVPEGSTIEDIAKILQEKNLLKDQQAFFHLCNDIEAFSQYDFLTQIPVDTLSERDYALEGYLFPDTYDVFADASLETIMNKMLLKFNSVFNETYISRAKELDMTIDEVMALASMIEREARVEEDFYKVSAVFHNRIKQDMRLESCASLQYVLKVKKYVYNSTERNTPSLYNTYLHEGLPVGPISNPGERAIKAALYPNEDYVEDGYLYFCNADPKKTSALLFSKTLQEHQQKQAEYEKYWTTQ